MNLGVQGKKKGRKAWKKETRVNWGFGIVEIMYGREGNRSSDAHVPRANLKKILACNNCE